MLICSRWNAFNRSSLVSSWWLAEIALRSFYYYQAFPIKRRQKCKFLEWNGIMKIGRECVPYLYIWKMQIRSHIPGIGVPHSCKVFFFPTLPCKQILSGKFLESEFWDNAQSESFCDVCWCWCNQSGLLERRLPLGIGKTKIGIGDEWGWTRNIEIIGYKRKCDHFPESKQKQLSLVHKTFLLNFYPIWNRNCFLSVLSKV